MFCQKISSSDRTEVIRTFGEKAADNMAHYTREWIDGKLEFMLGQLKRWSDEKIFNEFEKQI